MASTETSESSHHSKVEDGVTSTGAETLDVSPLIRASQRIQSFQLKKSGVNVVIADAKCATKQKNHEKPSALDVTEKLPSLDENDAATMDATQVPSGATTRITYSNCKVIGTGSFGVVYSATLENEGDVAIKKVLQDERYKNRELQILKDMQHTNVVTLNYYFYSVSSSKQDETYLNLVQEFIPQTLSRLIKHYWRIRQVIPLALVKLYSFQLLRGLAYIHSREVCHRDIKPQNLLINPDQGVLKICDFGSAKILNPNEPNVSYICSRYYRAPELIFGATHYTVQIDMWSAGCVIGELLLGQPLFRGGSGVDQLVEIIRILGTPTTEQVLEMNPNYCEFRFPTIAGSPWEKVIRHRTNEAAFSVLRKLLVYSPHSRFNSSKILLDSFFGELIFPPPGHPPYATGHLPSGKPAPQFPTEFTETELTYLPEELVTRIRACTDAVAQAACQSTASVEKTSRDGLTTPTNDRTPVSNYIRRRTSKASTITSNDGKEEPSVPPSKVPTRRPTSIGIGLSAPRPRKSDASGPTRTRSFLATSVSDMRTKSRTRPLPSTSLAMASTSVDVDQAAADRSENSSLHLSQSVHLVPEMDAVSSRRSNRSAQSETQRHSMYSLHSKKSNPS